MKREEGGKEEYTACLAVCKSPLRLAGKAFNYELDEERYLLKIMNSEHDFAICQIKTEEIGDFIRELQAIARNIEKSKQPLEMW